MKETNYDYLKYLEDIDNGLTPCFIFIVEHEVVQYDGPTKEYWKFNEEKLKTNFEKIKPTLEKCNNFYKVKYGGDNIYRPGYNYITTANSESVIIDTIIRTTDCEPKLCKIYDSDINDYYNEAKDIIVSKINSIEDLYSELLNTCKNFELFY